MRRGVNFKKGFETFSRGRDMMSAPHRELHDNRRVQSACREALKVESGEPRVFFRVPRARGDTPPPSALPASQPPRGVHGEQPPHALSGGAFEKRGIVRFTVEYFLVDDGGVLVVKRWIPRRELGYVVVRRRPILFVDSIDGVLRRPIIFVY